MLQFITSRRDKRSISEQAEQAILGGCRWIQIADLSADANLDERKNTVEQLIPLCKEHEAFLILENDVDLVEEMKVHGVLLNDNSRTNVMTVRERLGAEAVIGVVASTLPEIMALKGLDLDYITIKSPETLTADVDILKYYSDLISALHTHGVDFHFVAFEDINAKLLPKLIEAGCAGVAVSKLISDTDNPAEATSALLQMLDAARLQAESTDPDSIEL